MKTTPDRVIFRKWRNTGSIVACLPDAPANCGRMMMYEHVGQHGEGYYCHVVRSTRLATPQEYAPLLAELTGAPFNYVLRPMLKLARKS